MILRARSLQWLILAAAAWLALLMLAPNSPRQSTIATVDGAVIATSAFDAYAEVFTRPDGSLRISREQVLLSLLNQAIVARAAKNLALSVDTATIDQTIAAMERGTLANTSLGDLGDEAGLRSRVEMFILFEKVKEAVLGPISIPEQELMKAYELDLNVQQLGPDMGLTVVRNRFVEQETARRWEEWLQAQRHCADITIMDPTLNLPSSTPGPDCSVSDEAINSE